MKTLGIFITSDRFPEYVIALAQAARNQGLTVRIHFTGSGVRLVQRAEFDRLVMLAHHVSVCSESAASLQVDGQFKIRRPRILVPSKRMARIIGTCDRHLFI